MNYESLTPEEQERLLDERIAQRKAQLREQEEARKQREDANKQRFVEVLEELHDDSFRVRSYSGRGMYGDECVGVTAESEMQVAAEVIGSLVGDLYSDDESLAQDIEFIQWVLHQFKQYTITDDMGRDSIIVYWKNIPASLLTPRDETEDDEDE
jgi:hypothetical protein